MIEGFMPEKLTKRELAAYETMSDSQKNEFESLWVRHRQLENRMDRKLNTAAKEARKKRTHKVAELGGYAMSLIPESERMSNKQLMDILLTALSTDDIQALIRGTVPDDDPYRRTER